MGEKRDFSQVGSPDPDDGSAATFSNHQESSSIKKRKFNGKIKHRPSEGSSEWAKKRSRNIERLLKRKQDLPSNVQNELERELAALKARVSDKAFQKKRSAMISKYHMVRFFERKKAMRLTKLLRRKIEKAESPEEIQELRKSLHVAEVDEAYTQHFPHIEPYISLYTTKDKNGDEQEDDKTDEARMALLKTPRPPIWSEVEQAMKGGPDALRKLRERRPIDDGKSAGSKRSEKRPQKPNAVGDASGSSVKKPQQNANKDRSGQNNKSQGKIMGLPPVQGGMNRRERRRLMHQAVQPAAKSDDDDSDEGGFFD